MLGSNLNLTEADLSLTDEEKEIVTQSDVCSYRQIAAEADDIFQKSLDAYEKLLDVNPAEARRFQANSIKILELKLEIATKANMGADIQAANQTNIQQNNYYSSPDQRAVIADILKEHIDVRQSGDETETFSKRTDRTDS